MTDLERLAASTLCVGFNGTAPADAPLEDLRRLAPAGVVLFARNFSSYAATRALTQALRLELSDGEPPLLAVDQEGGRVTRIDRGSLPSMMAVGAARDPELASALGMQIGTTLRELGLSVNFAPVLDLALEPRNTVIGTRSFGEDPMLVAELGVALWRGFERAGIVSVVKHFPGHGATAVDSHVALPHASVELSAMRFREFVPYRAAVAAGVRAVMTAHVVYDDVDMGVPASLSRVFDDVLRSDLGFSGVCFTDCLEMYAVAKTGGTPRAAVAALRAGADILVLSHDLAAAFATRDAIVTAVNDGSLALERVEEAAARARALRRTTAQIVPSLGASDTAVDAAREIARRSITSVRGQPAFRATTAATVVSFEGSVWDGATGRIDFGSLHMALRTRGVRSEVMRVALEPTPEMIDQLLMALGTQPGRDIAILARRAHMYPAQAAAIERIVALAPDAIVVSALEPFDIPAFTGARNVLCSYGDETIAIEALADVLLGTLEPRGTLPVSLHAVPH